MLYSNCGQIRGTPQRRTGMQHLSPGSVICFGSTRHNEFCVDTVFVVATAHPWTPDHTTGLDLDEAFTVCTAQPLTILASTGTSCASGVCTRHPSGCPPATRVGLTLYRSATIDDPVHGMYSFVPARPAGHPNPRFVRPAVRLPGLINPRNLQSPRGARRP